MKKTIKTAMTLLLVGILACTVFAGCSAGNPVVNLNDYVIVEETGYDGYGTVEYAHIDYDAFCADYKDRIIEASPNEDGYSFELEDSEKGEYTLKLTGTTSAEEAAKEVLSLECPSVFPDVEDGRWTEETWRAMSNGDVITYWWDDENCDISLIEQVFNVEITYENFEYTMRNLGELKEVDPFVDVVFTTYGKHGEASITYPYADAYIETNDGIRKASVAVDIPENNGSLKNGDKVHVYISKFDPESIANEYGIKLSRTEADVEMSGLNGDSSYVKGEPGKVDLHDYISFGEYGISSSGRLQVKIDYESMLFDYREYFNENVPDEDMFGYGRARDAAYHIIDTFAVYEVISTSHGCDPSRTFTDTYSVLSNGDVVEFTWEADAEGLAKLQKVMNIEFQNTDFSYTMQGLEPIKEGDPFAEIDLWFEGKNGEGKACGAVICGGNGFTFEVISGNNGSLSNGDVITISVEKVKDMIIEISGLIPTRTEMEVVVTGLAE